MDDIFFCYHLLEQNDNGVLDGHTYVNDLDICGSEMLINNVLKKFCDSSKSCKDNFIFHRVLDCGAGIGRVSRDLLSRYFVEIDALEPCEHYCDSLSKSQLSKDGKLKKVFCTGLESFDFDEERKYDVIWLQWCCLYLTDEDFITLLKKVKINNPGSLIVIKENVIANDSQIFHDEEDNSVSRSPRHYQRLIWEAGAKLIHEEQQECWPEELQSVHMFVAKV